MHRWTLYSILATALLVVLIVLVEVSQFDIAITANTSEVAVFLQRLLPMGFILSIASWIYLLFYAQLQKHPEMLRHRIWKKIPIFLFILGLLSIFAFLMLGFYGPLMQWARDFRWLNDVFITYFIFLLFLFVLSVVRKDISSDHKTVHVSFLWTVAILVAVIFLV